MKKILLSLTVIVSFIAYAIILRGRSQPVAGVMTTSQPITPPVDHSTVASPAPPTPTAPTPVAATKFRNGRYSGTVEDALYGNVQVAVTVSSGKITDVQFLDYPHDRGTSVEINSQATPLLRTEAIQVQSAQVDIVSGATQTSLAFQRSLQAALQQAQ